MPLPLMATESVQSVSRGLCKFIERLRGVGKAFWQWASMTLMGMRQFQLIGSGRCSVVNE